MLCVPFLHGRWGSCGQQIQANVQRPIKQNVSPGEQSEAPRPRWKPGQEQNPGPENQDSQHMLEQPRGYFPEICPQTRHRNRKRSLNFKKEFPCNNRLPRKEKAASQLPQNAPTKRHRTIMLGDTRMALLSCQKHQTPFVPRKFGVISLL